MEEMGGQCAEPETVRPVAGTRVVFAAHALLQHDFPHLRDDALLKTHPRLRKLSAAERSSSIRDTLDEWLRVNSSFISESQAKQKRVNTPISTIAAGVTAFRPHSYGRALVLSLQANQRGLSRVGIDAGNGEHEGLLDVKGAGVAPNARPVRHVGKTGLLELWDALYEYWVQQLIATILRHAGSPYTTLPVYGILDLGFIIRKRRGSGEHRAALIVRRAHRRPMHREGIRAPGSPLVKTQFEIELLLRSYGLTSAHQTIDISDGESGLLVSDQSNKCHSYRRSREIERVKVMTGYGGGATLSLEVMNIQHTEESDGRPVQLLDFAGYDGRERFENPLVSMVSSGALDFGEIIHPGSPLFVQPRHRCQPLPTREQARELAAAFLNGALTGDEVRNKIEAETRRIAARWG